MLQFFFSESVELFKKSMKDSYIRVNMVNVLLFGVAGSGKTCLKLLLTNQPPPEQRSSTSTMEKPRRVNLRSVSSSNFMTTKRSWEEVSPEKILTQAIVNHSKNTHALRITEMADTQAMSDKTSDVPTEHMASEVVQDLTSGDTSFSVKDHNPEELLHSTWVHISDSGGQPQLCDISPLFTPCISAAVIVFRLSDDFSSFPVYDYYKDGQLVAFSHASHTTLGQILKSQIQSIESYCSQENRPKLIFVGTCLDHLVTPVSLEEKNKAVLDMLPASMKEQMVSSKSLNNPIFALNTLSREEDATTTANTIQKVLEACHGLEVLVPVWWHLLSLNFQKLCSNLKRDVLNKLECLLLAQRLGFDGQDLEAALVFFDEVCIACYYPSILPDTVFVNAQIPLDKISELIEYAIALRNTNIKGTIDGKLKRGAQEGLITLEFLKLDRFKKHYVEGLFSPEDMLLIMKELLVLAPIPLVGEADCSLSNAEFFMPSLLNSVPPAELKKYRISSDSLSPIAICFPSGSIHCGIFCCLIVYMMKVPKWNVLLPKSREPALLAKNCVKFRFPGRPCTITLIDSFSYIEVYIKSPPAIGKELCPTIRDQLLDGIQAACNVLHYNNDTPQVSIFCPCALSTVKLHLAEIDSSGYWICMSKNDVWGELPPQSRVWSLKNPAYIQGKHHL